VVRVEPADLVELAAFGQPLERVLADRPEHGEAGLAVGRILLTQQALVHERGESIHDPAKIEPERFSGDGFGSLERAAADERAEPRQQPLLSLVEQAVGPVDRTAQRALSRREIGRAAREQLQAALQAAPHGLRRQQLRPGGGKLDRERNAVEAPADLGDGGRVLGRQLEARPYGLHALDEQRDGGRTAERMGIVDVQVVRQGQGRHPVFVLAADAQRRLARDEEAELRCGGEQLGHEGRRGQDLLEVVEHEQRGAAAE